MDLNSDVFIKTEHEIAQIKKGLMSLGLRGFLYDVVSELDKTSGVGKTWIFEMFNSHLSAYSSNLCSTVRIDEQQFQKAIEISKTQKNSISGESEACESNNLREVIDKVNREDGPSSTVHLNVSSLYEWMLGALQAPSYSSPFYDVLAIFLNFIRYVLALIRYLLTLKRISYIVQAFHRIFYIPHSFIHGPGNRDDDHSNSFLLFTAHSFMSHKGSVLLASSGLG